jgi:hypothetical protein
MDYGHYDRQAKSNKTGFKDTILVAPVSWFTTLSAPPTTMTTAGDTAKITDDHVFAVDKGFIRMGMTQDSVELVGEAVGDNADSLGSKLTINAFKPGLFAEELELNKNLRNEDLIILLQDCNGTTYQIGNACTAAKGKPSVTGGTLSSGMKGTNWEFTAFNDLVIYEGTIDEKE